MEEKIKKLRLLYFTQKVDQNDDLLGMVYQWLANLAAKTESLTVVCLEKGECDLPDNCGVFSLGKEQKSGKFHQLIWFFKTVSPIIWRRKIDGIFVHMNQVYIFLLLPFWPLLKLFHVPVVWWKSHGRLNWSARLGRWFVDRIVTTAPSAFPINTLKKRVIGHGVDTNKFQPLKNLPSSGEIVKILAVGRYSAIKKYDLLLKALSQSQNKHADLKIHADIYGRTVYPADERCYQSLLELRRQLGLEQAVVFKQSVPNWQMPKIINQYDFMINAGGSNSLDKSTVEALSCAKIVIDSNLALEESLFKSGDFNKQDLSIFFFKKNEAEDLADKIAAVINLGQSGREQLGRRLRAFAVKHHDLNHLNDQIIETFIQAL